MMHSGKDKIGRRDANIASSSDQIYNHTFDPANIEYMGDALPLPYPTSPTKKRVVFQDKIINKTDEKPSSTIEIKHLLLCLYAGLSNRISQKELNLLGGYKKIVNL